MKVVYVLTTNKGGLPHYTAELANAVSKYAEVTVIKPTQTTADDIFSDKIEIIEVFKPMDISVVDIYKQNIDILNNIIGFLSYKNIKIINELAPDIVHFPADIFPQARIFFYLFKLDKKYRVIVTRHEVPPVKFIYLPGEFSYANSIPSAIIINIGNILNLIKIKIDKIIVHTKKNKERLVESGIHPEKVVIIPHGAYKFIKNYKNTVPKRKEKNIILFFGNIVPDKGLDTLIASIPIVAKEIPDIKLIIAGDGIIPKKSQEIIKKYKENFEVHNYYIPNEKVAEFFSRANLVVIPRRAHEGHSGSLTIAYSFGKPIITTSVGEYPRLVRDSGCGLVVPPNNPKALAEAIIKVLEDDKLRKKMSKNALKMAEKLSWDRIAKMHIKVYERVLEEKR